MYRDYKVGNTCLLKTKGRIKDVTLYKEHKLDFSY